MVKKEGWSWSFLTPLRIVESPYFETAPGLGKAHAEAYLHNYKGYNSSMRGVFRQEACLLIKADRIMNAGKCIKIKVEKALGMSSCHPE